MASQIPLKAGATGHEQFSATDTITQANLPVQAINAQTGTTYTLVLSDVRKLVTLSNASSITLTIPTNASVAVPVGDYIDLLQLGVGQVTVVAAGGVTVNGTPGLKLRAQYSGAMAKKIATDTWVIVGDLSA